MFLMYVDESGDPGLSGSPTRYFILSGIVIHETHWRGTLDRLLHFRRRMKASFGFPQTHEFHAAQMMARTGKKLTHIPKHNRLTIIKSYVAELRQMPEISLINVVVDKQSKSAGCDVYELAWKALIQRFENALSRQSFPGGGDSPNMGVIIPDDGQTAKLRGLLRKMRAYNPVPSRYSAAGYRDLPLRHIIEDPIHRDSSKSYLIQSADLVSWVLHQHLDPSVYVKKRGGKNYFLHLDPICFKKASQTHPQGVVVL